MEAIGPFKRPPRAHQMAALRRVLPMEFAALLMEQRTGKSQVVLDWAAHLYRQGTIDFLLVIAPNGVHRNWIVDEIPVALPDDVNPRTFLWQSGKMQTQRAKDDMRALLKHKGLSIVAINIDAIIRPWADRCIRTFLKYRRAMVVLDESLDIATPGSKRSQRARAWARHPNAVRRVIADGTPVDRGPLGLWSQFDFLHTSYLGKSFAAFKSRYAEYEIRETKDGKNFPALVAYRHLDELKRRIDPVSVRVRRYECSELPPKVFEKRYFDLEENQKRLYTQLRKKFLVEFSEGRTMNGAMVLTRYLRLQQITSNILVTEGPPVSCPVCRGEAEDCLMCEGTGILPGDRETGWLGDRNPRLEVFGDVVDRLDGQGIVWAKFQMDFKALRAFAEERKILYSEYTGPVDQEARARGLEAFRAGDTQLMIANPQSAGRGLDMSCASWMVFYSHGWSLAKRAQAEDRVINLAKPDAKLIIDLVATDTVDEKIVKALREGRNLARTITGDRVEDWI